MLLAIPKIMGISATSSQKVWVLILMSEKAFKTYVVGTEKHFGYT